MMQCFERDCVELDAFVMTDSFGGPPDYTGIPGTNGSNHLFLLESLSSVIRRLFFLSCTGARTTGSVLLPSLSTTAAWVHCPIGDSLNSGHVMLVWTEGPVRYAVSLHSDTPTNRAIALAVAKRLVPVTG